MTTAEQLLSEAAKVLERIDARLDRLNAAMRRDYMREYWAKRSNQQNRKARTRARGKK